MYKDIFGSNGYLPCICIQQKFALQYQFICNKIYISKVHLISICNVHRSLNTGIFTDYTNIWMLNIKSDVYIYTHIYIIYIYIYIYIYINFILYLKGHSHCENSHQNFLKCIDVIIHGLVGNRWSMHKSWMVGRMPLN